VSHHQRFWVLHAWGLRRPEQVSYSLRQSGTLPNRQCSHRRPIPVEIWPCLSSAMSGNSLSTQHLLHVLLHLGYIPRDATSILLDRAIPRLAGGLFTVQILVLVLFFSICRCFSIWFCLIRIHSSCLPIANFPCVIFTPGKSRPRNWGS
jgi:hypothetical protein